MEQSANIVGAAPYTATETGRALLTAMDVEEPFQLLSTLPRKLQELRSIGGHRESTTVMRTAIPLSRTSQHPSLGAAHRRYSPHPVAKLRLNL